MEENKEKGMEDIFSDAREYVELRIEHARLSAVEKGAKIFANLITNGTVVFCFILAFLFGTLTLAFFLSDLFGSYTKGFGCVASIYLLLAIIVYIIKNKFMEPRLIDLFIRTYFDKVADNEENDENDK